ncbi:MAG: sensor histidine kinase KdpD [Deltaproteobacteria bacterium]|nr:sensor histidine kinase KdpD [Deltaproteobacteria bacterium]
MPSMSEKRPDPDVLLAHVQKEERQKHRGKLRIFFGAAPGVGKTYAMLKEAHLQLAEGLDVVAGVVETHGRVETEELLQGLETIPHSRMEYKGVKLQEFDIDAALARQPGLILVDELAHTNAPGSRHGKRWQDVRELLDRGIDVYTTLNVQHIESLNDVVAQITRVVVRETVPDSILEEADAVVLVDLPPGDLLKRLKEGKVYIPKQAEWAAQNFFGTGNLIALRELALRITADRVNSEVLVYRQDQAIETTWPTSERLLVCVGPSPSSVKLIRATKRMAAGLHAHWLAVYVETPRQVELTDKQRQRAFQNLKLAEQLGAETITLSGRRIAEVVVGIARTRNVTKMVIGKPIRPRWKDLILGSPVDEIIRLSQEIDVYVISGDAEGEAEAPNTPVNLKSNWSAYTIGLLIWGICTAVAFLMLPVFQLSNLIMVYLLGVVITAIRCGRGPSVLGSLLSVLAFDYCFVPPRFTLAVADTQYFITFVVMLIVAVVISHLTALTRKQVEVARLNERRTASMLSLSRQLASTRGAGRLLTIATQHIADIFECRVVALLPDKHGRLTIAAGNLKTSSLSEKEVSVALWTFNMGQAAGRGTQTLPDTDFLYLPLVGINDPVGVLGVLMENRDSLLGLEKMRLLDSFAKQIALALEVDRLEAMTLQAQMETESERLRTSLLSSVTHDLQTPLAAIMGSAGSMLQIGDQLLPEMRTELAKNIYAEAERLSRLINNLLKMTKLESGTLKLNKETQPIEEVIGAALNLLERQLADRPVNISLPPDLPMVPLDSVLAEQLFINLMENALKYTPSGSPLSISARQQNDHLLVEVADRGPGLPPDHAEKIFDPFYRTTKDSSKAGHGLGLAICRGIVRAHGGQIWAMNRDGGGAAFRFTFPL